GTEHPDLAYELLKFMTSDLRIVSQLGALPAHRQVVQMLQEERFTLERDIAAIEQRAFPISRVPYADYVLAAWNKMRTEDMTAEIALSEQLSALQSIMTSATNRQSEDILMNAPDPALQLQDGEIALKFG